MANRLVDALGFQSAPAEPPLDVSGRNAFLKLLGLENVGNYLSNPAPPPIPNMPAMPGKIPGTDDPRPAGAMLELGAFAAGMLPTGAAARGGAALAKALAPKQATGAAMSTKEVRAYQNVPDSLMGFRRSGINKGYNETNFPHEQPVRVTLDSGDVFEDAIRGLNQPHALERAHRNWRGAVSIEPIMGETITGAAIKMRDGRIFSGADHLDAMEKASKELGGVSLDEVIKHVDPTATGTQGFLTSTGRVVDRQEAFDLANVQGQVKTQRGPLATPGELRSEDLVLDEQLSEILRKHGITGQ